MQPPALRLLSHLALEPLRPGRGIVHQLREYDRSTNGERPPCPIVVNLQRFPGLYLFFPRRGGIDRLQWDRDLNELFTNGRRWRGHCACASTFAAVSGPRLTQITAPEGCL